MIIKQASLPFHAMVSVYNVRLKSGYEAIPSFVIYIKGHMFALLSASDMSNPWVEIHINELIMLDTLISAFTWLEHIALVILCRSIKALIWSTYLK